MQPPFLSVKVFDVIGVKLVVSMKVEDERTTLRTTLSITPFRRSGIRSEMTSEVSLGGSSRGSLGFLTC